MLYTKLLKQVHCTGGCAALIAIWRLGPRRGVMNHDGTLKPVEAATRPIINAIGAFILWYGWCAFNIASPIAYKFSIHNNILFIKHILQYMWIIHYTYK